MLAVFSGYEIQQMQRLRSVRATNIATLFKEVFSQAK